MKEQKEWFTEQLEKRFYGDMGADHVKVVWGEE